MIRRQSMADALREMALYARSLNSEVAIPTAGCSPRSAATSLRAPLSAILAEQALIEAKIPFGLVFDEHLDALDKHRVLILPDSECLSDGQLESIKRYVENGGGVVAIGQAGLYDEWRRLRVKPGLQPLGVSRRPAKRHQETVEDTSHPGAAVRGEHGRGRIVYFPEIDFDGPLPETKPYFGIDNRYWKKPRNWREIAEAVRWATRDEVPVRVGGPSWLVTNLVTQPAQNRMLLHLENYNARSGKPVRGIDIALRPTAKPITSARLISPDLDQPAPLKMKTGTPETRLTVPEVKVHAIVELSWPLPPVKRKLSRKPASGSSATDRSRMSRSWPDSASRGKRSRTTGLFFVLKSDDTIEVLRVRHRREAYR